MDRPRVSPPLQVVPSKASRTELLAWLNDLLLRSPPTTTITSANINRNAPNTDTASAAAAANTAAPSMMSGHLLGRLHKVEQCGNGVPYVMLLPSVLPTPFPPLVTKAKIPAKHDFEAVVNLKLIADALQKNGIARPDVLNDETDKLIKGAYQANLQFLQWFRGLYDALLLARSEETDENSPGFVDDMGTLAACDTLEKRKHENESESLRAGFGTPPTTRTATTMGKENISSVSRGQTGRAHNSVVSPIVRGRAAFATKAHSTLRGSSSSMELGNSSIPHASAKRGVREQQQQQQQQQQAKPSGKKAIRSSTDRNASMQRRQSSTERRTSGSEWSLLIRTGNNSITSNNTSTEPRRPALSSMRNSHSAKRTRTTGYNQQQRQDSPHSGRASGKNCAGSLNSTGTMRKSAGAAFSNNIDNNISNNNVNTDNNSIATGLTSHKAGSARPLVDCSAAGTNGRSASPVTGQKRVTNKRQVSCGIPREITNPPGRLFQAPSAGAPSISNRDPRAVSQTEGSHGIVSPSAELTTIKNERQFYYDKLRQIENLIAPLADDKHGTSEDAIKLAQSVLNVLYSTN